MNRLLRAVVAYILAASAASIEAESLQSVIAYSDQSEYTTPDFSQQLLVPQFDSLLGQLQYVTISVTASLVNSTVDPDYLQALVQEYCPSNPHSQFVAPVDATVEFADGLGDAGRATDVNDHIYNCVGGGDGGRPSHTEDSTSMVTTITVVPPQAVGYIGAGTVPLSEVGSAFGQAAGGAYDIVISTEVDYFFSDRLFADDFE